MDAPSQTPLVPAGQTPPRHGCLTAWLIFMIVANALSAVLTPLSAGNMQKAGLHPSAFSIGIITLCAIANIGFAIALFKWMKLGFYGFVATAVIALIINLMIGVGIGSSLVGLIGIGILYWVLNMGGENKAWPRLR